MEKDHVPVYTVPHLDRMLFYTKNRIERDYVIWDLSKKNLTRKEIAKKLGLTPSVVTYVVLNNQAIGTEEEIEECFKLGFELNDFFVERLVDPNTHLITVLRSCLRHNIKSKAQLKAASRYDIHRICESHAMKRAGYGACEALVAYYDKLNKI